MVARRKKKYGSGEATNYMSRKSAVKYLQLSLKDFRRLCILKGVYPREPRNRKKAQKGKTIVQTLYHKKDIQFLSHEPLIWKMRDLKIFSKKMGKHRAMKEYDEMDRQLNNYPTLTMDHIVKERYPTFIDALRDLDDCLTLCFLFSTFPSLRHVPNHQSALCRRLTVEFLHAVIHAKALRKVFVSIKGYYYQIEYMGQTVTWITPHHFSFQPQDKEEVDFRIMATFVEFYSVMLGFINYHMYQKLNLVYPPKLGGYGVEEKNDELLEESAFVSERIAALSIPISKTGESAEEEVSEIDTFSVEPEEGVLEDKKTEILKLQKQRTLFKGLKFFLNREVPREPLVFMIRCFGGQVSWDKCLFVGATYEETDESITHQIVDRPSLEKQYLSRYYLQPQWIFDSVNACELLPIEKYLMGAALPPHLSPFTNPNRDQIYMPPEEKALKDPNYVPRTVESSESEDENVKQKDEEDSTQENSDNVKGEDEEDKNTISDEGKDGDPGSSKKNSEDQAKNMSVKRGSVFKDDPTEVGRQKKQEFHLNERMIPKKHRKLYRSMMEGRQKRMKEIWLLRKKRRQIDVAEREKKKAEKRSKKAVNNESLE